MNKPGPIMWLRYALVGSLPKKYSEWVLRDLTTGTWLVRHLCRVLVRLFVPETALILLIPATASIRGLTAFVTGACVVLLMSILANEMIERTVQRAGYPWGTAQQMREQRATADQRKRAAAYRERAAHRHGR